MSGNTWEEAGSKQERTVMLVEYPVKDVDSTASMTKDKELKDLKRQAKDQVTDDFPQKTAATKLSSLSEVVRIAADSSVSDDTLLEQNEENYEHSALGRTEKGDANWYPRASSTTVTRKVEIVEKHEDSQDIDEGREIERILRLVEEEGRSPLRRTGTCKNNTAVFETSL